MIFAFNLLNKEKLSHRSLHSSNIFLDPENNIKIGMLSSRKNPSDNRFQLLGLLIYQILSNKDINTKENFPDKFNE